jgi:hypothetical protein
MPYAEALSMSRQNAHTNTLAHRRAQKSPTERYQDHAFYPPSINIPYAYAGTQTVGIPFSAPAHYTSPPLVPTGHHATDPAAYNADGGRRPPFKHMQSAPGGLYTIHHTGFDRPSATQEGYPGQWQQTPAPHYTTLPPHDAFHPTQDVSSDTTNAFWKLSVTSPPATDISLPPPRPQNQWFPNSNNNYTHERPNNSVTLPTPHHSVTDSQPFSSQPQYFAPTMSTPVGPVSLQGSPHSSQPTDEHCEVANQWSRSTASSYRSGGSI